MDARCTPSVHPSGHSVKVWCPAQRSFTQIKLLASNLLGVQLHNPVSQRAIRRWQDRPFAAVVRILRDGINSKSEEEKVPPLNAFLGPNAEDETVISQNGVMRAVQVLS
eukprot:8717504-Pyramimonas_sp.AAC.1